MSYKNQEIWQLSKAIAINIHQMTLEKLPKFELFETGSQIRRSSKAVCSNIVEGYGRRQYKADYVKFLVYALSSNDETLNHLELLYETKSLTDETLYQDLHQKIEILGRKLNRFLSAIQSS